MLVSGGGTNLQALIDAWKSGELKNGTIAAVVSSHPGAFALERAKSAGIPCFTVDRSRFPGREEFTDAVVGVLQNAGADLVVLAGFLYILGPRFTEAFPNRVINVHPALIPSFCGEGFYGLRVHERALEYGVKVTGATVHFVSDVPDGGPIILQKAVEIREDDTPESLQRRVMEEAEWHLLPRAVSLFCQGRLRVEGRKVRILEEDKDR